MKRLLLIFLMGCTGLDTEETSIEPALMPYVERFVSEAKAHGVNVHIVGLRVEYRDLFLVAGEYHHKEHMVLIDTTDLFTVNAEWVVFHELGHALLKRSHRTELIESTIYPVSIMDRWRVMPDSLYQERREYYLKELYEMSEARM